MLRSTPADYFQPAVMISGGLTALGIAPSLTLLLWKPVAVVAFFFAVREYAHRSVERPLGAARRRSCWRCSSARSRSSTGRFGVLGDLFPGFLSWGYTFGLLALAAMVVALVGLRPARAPRPR